MSDTATTTTTTDDAGTTPEPTATAPTTPRTFTQEELEAELGKRLDRERKKIAKHGDVEELARKAAEFDKLSEAQKTELERATENARREAETSTRVERDAHWKSKLIASEVRVAAAGKLNDPADALVHLDLSSFELDDDGNADVKAIAAAIDTLVEQKPYLAAGTAPRPRTDFDAGARTRRPSSIPLNGNPLEMALRSKLGIPD